MLIPNTKPMSSLDTLLHRSRAKRDNDTGEIIERGKVYPTLDNLRLIFVNDERVSNLFKYNLFRDMILVKEEELTDYHITELKLWLRDAYNMRSPTNGSLVSTKTLKEAIVWYSQSNPIDPLKEWLEGLKWDGQKRLHKLFTHYFGAQDSNLMRELGIRWPISAVARALKAGSKVDTVLVLLGDQGAGKSSALRTLAGNEYFSDSHLDIQNKDAYQLIHQSGVCIWELAELDSFRKREASNIKMFLSSQHDRFRPSYGSVPVTRHRRTIFAATSNPTLFLNDPTGARRFWPVEVSEIDLESIKTDRDQLWAEAVHMYKDGSSWWLSKEMDEELKRYQEGFTIGDPWELVCRQRLTEEGVTIGEIFEQLEVPMERRRQGQIIRIANILKRLGASKRRSTFHNGQKGRFTIWYKEPVISPINTQTREIS